MGNQQFSLSLLQFNPNNHNSIRNSNNNSPDNNNNHDKYNNNKSHPFLQYKSESKYTSSIDEVEGERIPLSLIPSSDRANSDNGLYWFNPSPNQLYRALKRKNKPIEQQDAFSVSAIHEAVT